MKNHARLKRYTQTLKFMSKHITSGAKILDLGTENTFSKMMKETGYDVRNTLGEDLDLDYHRYINLDVDIITSFEIFEHMLAPFNILREMKTDKLIASIPLKLWFTDAYWNEADDWDKHYHEFEKKQFDFLLKKTGWKIIDHEIWTSVEKGTLGLRPLLRHFFPRYYIVYCKR